MQRGAAVRFSAMGALVLLMLLCGCSPRRAACACGARADAEDYVPIDGWRACDAPMRWVALGFWPCDVKSWRSKWRS